MSEKRKTQRRKRRVGRRCRRCKGTRYVPTGEPDIPDPNGTGVWGTPIKPCSCTENEGK